MQSVSSYSVKIKGYNRIFRDTVRLYRAAVNFYIDVMTGHRELFAAVSSSKAAVNEAESLTVATKKRPHVERNFREGFYKFPSYLRRAAIAQAFGLFSSWNSNRNRWLSLSPAERGKEPSVPSAGFLSPSMYKDNCFVRTGTYTARLKVYIRNTWDWLDVEFRKSDIDYILRHCAGREACVPTLQKRGKCWYLDFAFKEVLRLTDVPVTEQRIIAVDLGINASCTCVCMQPDGTILGRHFLRLSREYDCLDRRISRIKRAQKHGSRNVSGLWRIADGANDDIAVRTAGFIMDTAILYNADVIVFEHLDLSGKKRGSKRQRLHLWKAGYVQSMVTDKAHRLGMRISRINAWGTSRLAFDGSGRVMRGCESEKTDGSYSVCEFRSGKVYNCDLNAAYNIGARYFVREIIKSLPATDGQRITAKVPGCAKRSTCTLSTLISLNAGLYAAA